ncbi:MAG: hypothetical protein OIF50_08645 [Flavobacteriaceae bacterium]|nr:hypothetical protein [Flavobacteriaceae bacterium]
MAKHGEFRVQDDFGGTISLYNPKKDEIAFGQKIIEACPHMPYYARVDLLCNNKMFWYCPKLNL